MSDNETHGRRELTTFETEELRIRQKEIDVRLKELELQREEYKFRRSWFRNPTVISGFALAYVTVLTTGLTAFYAQKETDRKYAIEYIKVALELLESPSQRPELTEWARDVFRHFAYAPFDGSTPRASLETSAHGSRRPLQEPPPG
jgi:hypothetical protein